MPSVDPNPWWWLYGFLVGLQFLGGFVAVLFALMMLAALAFDYWEHPPDWWKRWRGR